MSPPRGPRPRRRVRLGGGRARGPGALALLAVVAALILARRSSPRREEPQASPTGSPPAASREPGSPTFEERVERVHDGDTLSLAGGSRVRLLGIDAPEEGRPFAEAARSALEGWTLGRSVRLRLAGSQDEDGYGRLLALVTVAGDGESRPLDVNAELLRRGLAMVYLSEPDALPSDIAEDLLGAQRAALAARRGLWEAVLARGAPPGQLVSTRLRIHRRGCPKLAGHATPPALRDLRGALGEGKSPCRECAPLE